ncbi:type II secretion system protein [Actinotalea soli]|uniref:type II secretion system protein n=1 Tax=Actinotalea soli TaxID=2819234 RepID=UPI0027DCA7D6|nr:prepilin-type N-terminal cleavage/methylation domain-containing protein [Actinotalea soli]
MIARIRKSIEEKDQGFTLIELLVVMIIIGILAAIAIPVFLNQRKSAVDASIKSDLRTIATSVETIYVDHQAYPTFGGGASGADVTLTPPGTGATPTSVAISSGNTVTYTALSGGYCLRGTNPDGNASSTTASTVITYNSLTGGLGSAPCTAP